MKAKKLKKIIELELATHVASGFTATPTDLSDAEVADIAETVNPLIADAFALYVKTKNFHWHLSGPHFRDFHLLFDEQAEGVLDSIDMLAERLRKLGANTILGISHIAALQTIKDDSDASVKPNEMVKRLLADNRHCAKMQRDAIKVCDKNRDTSTASVLEGILDQTEKRIWFLFATSQEV